MEENIKIKKLGQIFTPENIVSFMCEMISNNGSILEPSCGRGSFTFYIKNKLNREIDSIEIDPSICKEVEGVKVMDFFDLDLNKKYDTIIGNPPYIKFNDIKKETLKKIKEIYFLNEYDNRTNLYIFFIRKCIEHLNPLGELIFITPRNFIKSTSARKLNTFLYNNGTITNWIEYGDEIIFKNYSPNVVAWRFEKNNLKRKTKINKKGEKRIFKLNDGQISFVKNDKNIRFGDLFFVKVGAVSGADEIFTSEMGNKEFVCSYTKKTGKLKKMFYNIKSDYLRKYKNKLIKRSLKKFDESNWWKWGRGLYESEKDRIYVNVKTRDKKPFFINSCKNYDGSVLGIFPKEKVDINKCVNLLNEVDWKEIGFMVGKRLHFSQKSLENVHLSKDRFSSIFSLKIKEKLF